MAIAGGTFAIKETLDGAKDQLQPLADGLPWVGNVVAILTIAGAVLVVAGLAYQFYATRKAKKFVDALDLLVSPA